MLPISRGHLSLHDKRFDISTASFQFRLLNDVFHHDDLQQRAGIVEDTQPICRHAISALFEKHIIVSLPAYFIF